MGASPILVSDGYTTAKMRQIATGALILCVVAATVSFPQGPPSYPFSPYAHAGAQPNQWSSVNVLAGLLQSGAIPGAFPAFGNYGGNLSNKYTQKIKSNNIKKLNNYFSATRITIETNRTSTTSRTSSTTSRTSRTSDTSRIWCSRNGFRNF